MLSLETVGAAVHFDLKEKNKAENSRKKQYEVSITMHQALEKMSRTVMITISPKYFLVNATKVWTHYHLASILTTAQYTIRCKQFNSFQDPISLAPASKIPFHWPDDKADKTISFAVAPYDEYQGSIVLDSLDNFVYQIERYAIYVALI